MAKLIPEKISKVEKNSRLHDPCECTYNVFHSGSDKYIQFNTYGSETRKFKNTVSQSIQFDKATASFLVNILREEFNL